MIQDPLLWASLALLALVLWLRLGVLPHAVLAIAALASAVPAAWRGDLAAADARVDAATWALAGAVVVLLVEAARDPKPPRLAWLRRWRA